MIAEHAVPRLRKVLYVQIIFMMSAFCTKSKHVLQLTVHSIHLQKKIGFMS